MSHYCRSNLPCRLTVIYEMNSSQSTNGPYNVYYGLLQFWFWCWMVSECDSRVISFWVFFIQIRAGASRIGSEWLAPIRVTCETCQVILNFGENDRRGEWRVCKGTIALFFFLKWSGSWKAFYLSLFDTSPLTMPGLWHWYLNNTFYTISTLFILQNYKSKINDSIS